MTDVDFQRKLQIALDSEYADDVFARGYLVSKTARAWAPAHWKRDEVLGYQISRDPRTEMRHVVEGSTELLCIGVIYGVRSLKEEGSVFTRNLALALAQSEAEFLSELRFAGGRFVLLYRRGHDDEVCLLTDATGMRAAFYVNDGVDTIVSSHAYLTAAAANTWAGRKEIPFRFGYPGCHTPFAFVNLLTPNTKLKLRERVVERYWPKKSLQTVQTRTAAAEVKRYMVTAFKHVARIGKPILSVTAGMDSRVTLSLSRDIPGVEYFTYYREDAVDTDGLDREFARAVGDRFGLPHSLIDRAEFPTMPAGFREISDVNALRPHLPRIAFAYKTLFGSMRDVIHIRSNLSEIGRRFYDRADGRNVELNAPEDLARLWLRAKRDYPEDAKILVRRSFESFCEKTNFMEAIQCVDPRSLFYWEHRMGSWHSQVVSESDPAFETVSLYNSICILELMLSVPPVDQKNSVVLREIVRESWPELAEYAVNGKPF